MRLLSDDAARLSQGQPALADATPELAGSPGRLALTFGFGPGLFEKLGLQTRRPTSLHPLPAFGIDRLETRWTGGDLLVQIASDDSMALSHARRVVTTDAATFTTVRWVQEGFLPAAPPDRPGATPRNLMGQLDGTVNPRPGTAEFEAMVWAREPDWFAGGTLMVLRRIRMDLDAWDAIDTSARDQVMGRRLSDGAPLGGAHEDDEPDFAAKDSGGLVVIPEFAHIRRSRGDAKGTQFLRRSFSYDSGVDEQGAPDAGLLFIACQADIDRQYLPVQRRLDKLDLLNTWTTPVGSAVFALPPGCAPGGWIGEGLLRVT